MRIANRRCIFKVIVGLILISALFCFFLSYETAKVNAIKSLRLVTIHDEESRQIVKNEIYSIVSPEIRKTVFEGELDIGTVPAITYQVNSAKGYITGINDYTFVINWTSNGYYTINSAIEVKNGIVIDGYRVD